MQLRDGDRQQATGHLRQASALRPVGGQMISAVDFLAGMLRGQPVGQRQDVAGRRAPANAHAVALVHDGRASGTGQRQQAGLIQAQRGNEVLVTGHASQQLDQHGTANHAFLDRARTLLQGNLQRQDLAHELAGRAHVVGQAARLHRMARHQPHNWPSWTSETDIDAPVPMLRMYCRCTGDTLRSTARLRSVGGASRCSSARINGAGV